MTTLTPPALATRALSKSFGSLAVTQSVEIAIPQGSRYALIGPNGAGKTTLINLMTGLLKPDSGAILLNCEDITAIAPDDRVKRGLTRTFQINQLFPNLTALEAVTLVVAERQQFSGNWWRRLPAYRDAIAEADQILQSLRFGGDRHRLTRELPYGRQRLLEIALALATKPKVLLLDEPAAGVPKDESAELFQALSQLPADITVLFIEHDMDLVFRFATRIIVLVAGQLLVEGTPAEISSDPRVREVYLGRGHHG